MTALRVSRTRLGVLISGRGSNLVALHTATRKADYPAEIVCVISNRPGATGLAWAQEQGLDAHAIDHQSFDSREAFEDALQMALDRARVEVVACAGFLRLMTPAFVDKWRDRMLNIHPSLLPSFTGLHTHARALAGGVKITGCTVHLVRPEMDTGPILAQAAVPVLAGDTEQDLAARVLAAEHVLYPTALEGFLLARSGSTKAALQVDALVNQTPVLFSPNLADAAIKRG